MTGGSVISSILWEDRKYVNERFVNRLLVERKISEM